MFLGEYGLSIQYSTIAVRERPWCALASEGLSLCYSLSGRLEEYFEEVKRFIVECDSDHYDEYLIGMITVTEMALGEEKEVVADMKREMREGDFDGWNVFTGAILPILDRTPMKLDEDE